MNISIEHFRKIKRHLAMMADEINSLNATVEALTVNDQIELPPVREPTDYSRLLDDAAWTGDHHE